MSPVMPCQRDGQSGFKWGPAGVCFTGADARDRAAAVGRAIHAQRGDVRRALEAGEVAEIEKAIGALSPNAFVEFSALLPVACCDKCLDGETAGCTMLGKQTSQQAQTVIFSTEESPGDVNGGNGWTARAAAAWLRDHDFRAGTPDRPDSGTQLRYRQFDPDRCRGRFQTLTRNFPSGISVVACSAEVQRSLDLAFDVRKVDGERGLVFGWASVAERDGMLVVDHEGDTIFPEDLEAATYEFVKSARVASDSHRPESIGAGTLVECMCFTKEKQAALGIQLDRVGTWVGFELHDPELRRATREGDRLMFSIGGSGYREEA